MDYDEIYSVLRRCDDDKRPVSVKFLGDDTLYEGLISVRNHPTDNVPERALYELQVDAPASHQGSTRGGWVGSIEWVEAR